MRLSVKKYVPPPQDYFICRDAEGEELRVDLLVDGSIEVDDPNELVGTVVLCDYLNPYISLAMGARKPDPGAAAKEDH